MIEIDTLVLPPEAAEAAATFLRAGGAGEESLVESLVLSGAELCERFTGLALIARGFAETMVPTGNWQRLARTPVRSISSVSAIPLEGDPRVLEPDAHALDIDSNGDGWVRLVQAIGRDRIRVAYQAGLAAEWPELPAPLRHGVIRLAAHLYAMRTGVEPGERRIEPPAAVAALWRPYRRLRLS